MSAQRWLPGEYEIVPNGVLIPDGAEPGGREHRVVFAGRQEPRKGLHVLLRAWPEIRRRTGARLRIAGADPLAVRLLLDAAARLRRRNRRARLPQPGGSDGRARVGEGARRAVARRRELRDGAHARVRVRDAGRRVRHPRLPRRDDAGDLRRRAAGRAGSARRGDRRAARGRAAPRGARRRRAAARDRALLVGRHRAPARRHLRLGPRRRDARRWPRERRPAQPLAAGCARRPVPRRGRRPALVARPRLERRLPRLRSRQLGAGSSFAIGLNLALGARCARSRGG